MWTNRQTLRQDRRAHGQTDRQTKEGSHRTTESETGKSYKEDRQIERLLALYAQSTTNHRQTRQTDRQTDRQRDRQTHTHTQARQTDRQDRQTDRQTDRETDRRAE